jgi:hypothetical protein
MCSVRVGDRNHLPQTPLTRKEERMELPFVFRAKPRNPRVRGREEERPLD